MVDLLIYTDLDGTLLDHHSYSYAAAMPALTRLKDNNIPLIFNSSKTAAEIESLRCELNLHYPYIVENGSSVCGLDPTVHEGGTHTCGVGYQQLLTTLEQLRRDSGYEFEGFHDMTMDRLCAVTGLDSAAAALAKQRHASEPLLWLDTEEAFERFCLDLGRRQLRVLKGGRFYHVMGQADKATALHWLTDQYRNKNPGKEWKTVALGDGENDRAMLESADIAVVIPPAVGNALQLKRKQNVIYPCAVGPAGWNEALSQILDQELNQGD